MIRENNIALICSMIMCNEMKTSPSFSFLRDEEYHGGINNASPACFRCSQESVSLGTQQTNLVGLEGIEGLVSIADEWQTHLGFLRVRHGTGLGTVDRAGILLRNLINGEVRHIDV